MNQTNSYGKIRFIGYAVPTTPADVVGIRNSNSQGAVANEKKMFSHLKSKKL